MSLFVDSSAWCAAVDAGDPRNERARVALAAGEPLVTTDHVLVESWLLITRPPQRHAANGFWDQVRGGVATVEVVGAADLEVAATIRDAFSDQAFSLVDLTCFAVMLRVGLHRVVTFDKDFAIYRFGPRRDKAFTIVN